MLGVGGWRQRYWRGSFSTNQSILKQLSPGLPAGEYIAVEKIEGVLDDSPLIDQAGSASALLGSGGREGGREVCLAAVLF